jgi:hypothetical protein
MTRPTSHQAAQRDARLDDLAVISDAIEAMRVLAARGLFDRRIDEAEARKVVKAIVRFRALARAIERAVSSEIADADAESKRH